MSITTIDFLIIGPSPPCEPESEHTPVLGGLSRLDDGLAVRRGLPVSQYPAVTSRPLTHQRSDSRSIPTSTED